VKKVENQRIEGETVALDGKAFVNCVLIDCVVEYSGSPFMLVDTELKGCRYVFFGAAKGTVHLLQSVGMMPFEPSEWGEFPAVVQ